MTDDLTGAAEARERARRLLAKAAGRRATGQAAPGPAANPAPAAPADGMDGIGAGLHDLLRDLAAYLGDRPQKDRDAMALYERVMRMLGEGAE